jgi:23S rRNA A2030 N6-methylase RlmJ
MLSSNTAAAVGGLRAELGQYDLDGKEAQATDVFRQAIALLVKRQVRVYSSAAAAV